MLIDHDLELIIQCNRKVVNFLDVILNLENSTYHPYLKDNNKIIYVNTESNYPPSVIKQLSKSIELRLSQLPANKKIFQNSVTRFSLLEKSPHSPKICSFTHLEHFLRVDYPKIPLSLSLLSIWKSLIHFRIFIVSSIYVSNDVFEADLFFLYTDDSCLLYQYTISKKLGENLNKKLWLVCW